MTTPKTPLRPLHLLLAFAAAVLLLPVPAVLAQDDASGVRTLAQHTADVYRQAARYPNDSRPVEAGALDPVRAERVPAPHSLPGRNADSPLITVWSREVSFEAPAPVDLYATVDRPGQGGGKGQSQGQGGKVAAAISGEVITADGETVGSVVYNDDGKGVDRRAGDGIYSARFTLPQGAVPDLAASFGVRVTAKTADGETVGTTGGFLYSNPHAHLGGEIRDEVRDGNLVMSVEVTVEKAGRFHLAGTLAEMNGTPVGWAQTAAELEPGTHTLELSFYGLMFRDHGVAGPYRLASLSLSTTTSMPNALNDLVEDAHRTAAYPLSAFTDRGFGNPGLLQAADRLVAAPGKAGH